MPSPLYPVTDISIIITAYNVERYIERAVYSALNQQGDISLEVIVVDDGSRDNTWKRIISITDPRIRCIRHMENRGPSAARNAGIAQASGKWIAVLDGDDAFEGGRLKRCIQLAEAHHADVVVDNICIYREADGAMFPMFPAARFSALEFLSLADFIGGNSSFFMKGHPLGYLKPIFSASFLRDHGLHYETALHIGEDYILLAEVLASGALCVVEKTAGYIYTIRKDSISHRLSLENIRRIRRSENRFAKRYALTPQAAKAYIRRRHGIEEIYRFTLLVNAIKRKDIKQTFIIMALYPAVTRYLIRSLRERINRSYTQWRVRRHFAQTSDFTLPQSKTLPR